MENLKHLFGQIVNHQIGIRTMENDEMNWIQYLNILHVQNGTHGSLLKSMADGRWSLI